MTELRVLNDEEVMDIDIPCEACDTQPNWVTPTVRCLECIGYQHRKAQYKRDIEGFIEWCEWHHCGHPDGVIPEVPLEISYDDWQSFKRLVEEK